MAKAATGRRPAGAGAEEDLGTFSSAWGVFGPEHVPYRMLLLAKILDRLATRHVRALAGLSLPEWRVIAHLAVMGEQSASALSSAALIDRAEVSRAVALLTRKGMIGKRPNVRNRRSQLLHLTPEGQAVFDRVHDRRRRFFQMITSDLDEKELAVFDALLLRMACRAGQIERAGVSALDTL